MIRVFVIVVFLLHLNGLKGDMTYILGNETATWRMASTECTLATPRINFIGGEMIAEVSNAPIRMREGDEAWVGYSLEPVILQSVGCMAFDINKEPDLARYFETGADPGRCFSACREVGYIGLMDTRCFCLRKLVMESIFETECTMACSGISNQAVCGGKNFVSIYKQAENITASEVQDYNKLLSGNCIIYDKNVNTYYTKMCSISKRIGCQDNFGDPINIGSRTVTWLQMTRFCYSQKLFTYAHNGVLADNGTYLTMWTGMIKANKLTKTRQWKNDQLTFAYMKVESSYFKLHFSTLAYLPKRFLCQIGGTTPSTTTLDPTPEVEPEAETKVTSEPEPEPVAEGSVSNLLPVYIIVPLVIIALAILLIFLVIRWRRKKRNDQLKSNSLMKGSNEEAGANERNRPVTEKSRLSRENVGMYDIMQNDGNPPTENGQQTTEQKPMKRPLNPNYSNNLLATLPLDDVSVDNNDETEAVSTANAFTVGKPDNEYARINKGRKVPPPKVPGDGQTYDKVGNEKKVDDESQKDPNYDKLKLETEGDDMYDTTVKPKTDRTTNRFYDGLSKF